MTGLDTSPIAAPETGAVDLDSLPGASAGGGRRYRWVVRRLLLGVLTLVLVSVLVFAATEVLPGDAARAILGHDATPHDLATVRRQLGLDKPLPVQYWTWLHHLLTGDLGRSLTSQQPVTHLLADRIFNSAVLVALAAAIAMPLAAVLGAVAGRRRGRPFDHAVLIATLGLTALPEFIVALVLVILFSTSVFHWLPATVLLAPGQNPLADLEQLIMPVAALVMGVLTYLTRLVRGSVIDAYDSEYVRMARLKGIPERVILRRHVLPNALVPAIQGGAVALASLTGGVVIVEQVFNYPGLGSALVSAVNDRDLPVVQAISLIFATAYVVFNLIGDLLTIYVTPRLRTAAA